MRNQIDTAPLSTTALSFDTRLGRRGQRARDVGLLPRTALPAHSRDGNLRALARKARDKI